MPLTPEQCVEALNKICTDCGRYESPQRSMCACCLIEQWRTGVVWGLQVQKKMAAEVAASTTVE